MTGTPSAWIERFAPLLPAGGRVLDLACGDGRHTRLLLGRGLRVIAVDRDLSGVADLAGHPRAELLEIDLEDGRRTPAPLAGPTYEGIVVTRYLHRPLLPAIVVAVADGGVLLYETFSAEQPDLGRPTNPDFLLRPGELLGAVRDQLRVLAYEDLVVTDPAPAAVQRICARRGDAPAR